MTKFILLSLTLLFPWATWSACPVLNSNGSLASAKRDGHYLMLTLAQSCPENVLSYKNLLLNSGLTVKPSMVANRGRNNPEMGSFSFFEEVTGLLKFSSNFSLNLKRGEFFFGHFTAKQNGEIVLDQAQRKGQLLIELIAWDDSKKLFNFYELIGIGSGAKWFYRGDSQDILQDNQFLYLSSSPQFGKRLRCSACHTSGGPIMKELAPPHNDWWTQKRPLSFGSAKPSATVSKWVGNLQSAEDFSFSVQQGTQKLFSSSIYQQIKSGLSLREQLRPLFCDTEINLISSLAPSSGGSRNFTVSSSGFLNPLMAQTQLNFSTAAYTAFASKYKLQFPETGFKDADHLWLAPVKSYADLLSIEILVRKGLIDLKFVYDVLSLDAKNSLFSAERCQLLKLLPTSTSGGWKNQFALNLKASPLPAAQALSSALTDKTRTVGFYQKSAQDYLITIQKQGLNEELFLKLLKDRNAVFSSEISKNPMGQILEPGFRVIFPVPH